MSLTNSKTFFSIIVIFLFLQSLFLLIINIKLRQDLKTFEINYIERSKLVADNIESLEFRCFALSLNTLSETFPYQINSYQPVRISPPQRVFTNAESICAPPCSY